MSKIGRMPISFTGVKVKLSGNKISYEGPHSSGEHVLPPELQVELSDDSVRLLPSVKESAGAGKGAVSSRGLNRLWGLHRALLKNKLLGASNLFERRLKLVGLGFKFALNSDRLELSLGFSHKVDFDLPEGVSGAVDKGGQRLTLRSSDLALLGGVCGSIRSLRPPEPYKGKGILWEDEVIRMKVGKAKAV